MRLLASRAARMVRATIVLRSRIPRFLREFLLAFEAAA